MSRRGSPPGGLRRQGGTGGRNGTPRSAGADGAPDATGQRCTAPSRTIVVESVADRFLDKILARARQLKVGAGLEETTDIGPAVTAEQRSSVLNYLEIGIEEGAEQVYGGEPAQ